MILASLKLPTIALITAGMLVGPVWADVIPAESASTEPVQHNVAGLMAKQGLASAHAQRIAGELTSSEAAYFTRHPGTVTLVSGEGTTILTWLMVGGVIGVGIIAASVIHTRHQNNPD